MRCTTFHFFVFLIKKKLKKKTHVHSKKKIFFVLLAAPHKKKEKEKAPLISANFFAKNMAVIWILYIIFILVGIAFIVLLPLFFRPKKTVESINANTLQSAYDNGDGTLNVEGPTLPFAVNMNKDGIHYNCATFSDTTGAIDSFLNRVVANTFTVTNPSKITNLQVIADFLHVDPLDPTRVVAIYDTLTSEKLVSASVGLEDPIIDGFYTHSVPLLEQVTLEINRVYAVVAEVRVKDFIARDTSFVQTASVVVLHQRAIIVSPSITLPNADQFSNDDPNNLQFGSFQFVNLILNQTVFQVDSRSQNPSFPINYVYNLNVQCETDVVQLEPGLCMSDAQNNNMLNNTIGNLVISPQVVGVANGLDVGTATKDQWYAVFLMTSTAQGLPPAGMLSLNRQMPSFMPVGYESSKRVGWARSTSSDNVQFFRTLQQGNGTRRQTIYQAPLPVQSVRSFSVLDIENETYFTIPLTLVSPTSSSVVLQITVENVNFNPVRILIKEPDNEFALAQVPSNGGAFNTVSVLLVEFPISNYYSPHRMQVALGTSFSVANDVSVTFQVQSYFDDL